MDGVRSLYHEQIEALEAAIASSLNAQDADIALIISETQVDINIAEDKKQIIIAERERRIAAVHDVGRLHLEELRRELAYLQHELAVVASPILVLPNEVTAEIFQWHAWRGEDLRILLLVCKRWTAIACASPRLWSRIHLGSRYYRSLSQLRLFLSRSQSSPLQIKFDHSDIRSYDVAPTSLWHKSLGRANHIEAIKLILGNKVLGRCTTITIGDDPIPWDDPGYRAAVEAMTMLPLLSSICITAVHLKEHERRLVQSLAGHSPSLRHMHCCNEMSPQDLGLGAEIWAKRVETLSWMFPSHLWNSIHELPSLRELRIWGSPVVPLSLPALQELWWAYDDFHGFHFITAPQLHTLMVWHARKMPADDLPAGSITLPNLRVAIHNNVVDISVLRAFHTPSLEHLSISMRSSALASLPTPLFQVFDGSNHMPTPKSLHLCCAFNDAALIAVLRRLPQLEELRVVGGILQEVFWEALSPPCDLYTRSHLLESHLDAGATNILIPKLQILLVDNSEYIKDSQRSHKDVKDDLRARLLKGGRWTVSHASAVAVARERVGCPLKTLACWSTQWKVTVLIGSLERLPQRPRCVLLVASCAAEIFLTCYK